jgi:large subunit ribosomal protein L29
MKALNIREQTDEELQQACRDMRRELFDLRIRKRTGEGAENPLRIRTLRRDVARAMTVLRERGVAP